MLSVECSSTFNIRHSTLNTQSEEGPSRNEPFDIAPVHGKKKTNLLTSPLGLPRAADRRPQWFQVRIHQCFGPDIVALKGRLDRAVKPDFRLRQMPELAGVTGEVIRH